MAASHGSKAVFQLTDAGGTSRDISAYVNTSGLQKKIDAVDVTGQGQGSAPAKSFIPGLSETDIPIEANWDDAATTGTDAVLGGIADAGGVQTNGSLLTFIYGPKGSGSGARKYTGSCILTSYDENAPVGGKLGVKANLKVSGAVTRTTFP